MPVWTTFNGAGNIFTFSPPTGTTGSFTVFFDISDGSNTLTKQFSVVVIAPAPNAAPTFSGYLNNLFVNEGT